MKSFLYGVVATSATWLAVAGFADPCLDMALYGWMAGVACATLIIIIGVSIPDPTKP